MRTRFKPWIKDALKELCNTILVENPKEFKGRWYEFFSNGSPIHLELGMGKGRFISTLATNHKDVNFIGIEVQEGVIYYPAKRFSEEGYTNLALLKEDVKGLTEYFAQGEVERIYINFCDPWPKARHAKRRLTHKNFLKLYKTILKPGGSLCLKTDNRDLFSFSLEEFQEAGWDIMEHTWDLHDSKKGNNEPKEGIVLTEYEEKFIKKGIPISFLEAGIPQIL